MKRRRCCGSVRSRRTAQKAFLTWDPVEKVDPSTSGPLAPTTSRKTDPKDTTATGPIDGPQGYTPTCGAWLTTHMWEHYLYSGDKKFLAEVYPIFKGACLFFIDTLVEDPQHHNWLVTNPSCSPENSHPPATAKSRLRVCAGPTMDESILRDLFAQTISASEIDPARMPDDVGRAVGAASAQATADALVAAVDGLPPST